MAAGRESGYWRQRKEEHRHGAGQDDLGDQEGVSTTLLVVIHTPRERKRKERSASDNRAPPGRGQALVGGNTRCGSAETRCLPCLRTSRLSAGSESGDRRTRAARETVSRAAGAWASAQDGLAAGPSLSVPVQRRAHRGSLRDDSGTALHIICGWVGAGPVRRTKAVCRGGAATDRPMDDHRPERAHRLGHVAALDSRHPCGHVAVRTACLAVGFHRTAGG